MLTFPEAERLLVAAVLRKPDLLALLTLKSEQLADPFLSAVYEAARSLWERGEPVDLPSVADAYPGRPDGLVSQLMDLERNGYGGASVSKWEAVVVKAWKLRSLAGATSVTNQASKEHGADPDELIDKLEDDLRNLRLSVVDTGPWSLGANTSAERYEARESEGHDGGVRFLLGTVDWLVSPLRPGQLVIVGARPSVGKTALAVHLCYRNAQRGKGSLVVSLEMSREDMEDRFAAFAADVSLALLSQGNLSSGDKARHREASAAMRVLPVQIGSMGHPTLGQIRAQVRKAQRDPSMSFVVVDYLGLVQGPKTASREQEVAAISRGLKAMAVDLNIPVVALAQLNRNAESRDGEGNRPKLADLRDSGQIEQDADVVVLLHRDKEKLGLLELIVAKQRNGPTGKAVVECHMDTGRLNDLEAV